MRIALIQMKANDIKDYEKCAEHILKMINYAAEKKPDMVLLPECAYPGYIIDDKESLKKALEKEESFLEKLKSAAKEKKTYIAIGMVTEEEGKTENSAVVINKEGNIVYKHVKSNMWHCDSDFYVSSDKYDVFETEFGKIGVIICADGRMPEISAILAEKGAELIINLANLTSSGFDEKNLHNPQTDYILPARCAENNVYMAVCCKTGVEKNILNNAGGSCIISPNGEILASLGSGKEEILVYDIDLSHKKINAAKNENYKIISEKTENLPVIDFIKNGFKLKPEFVSTVSFKAKNLEEYITKAHKYISLARMSYSKFIVLPQTEFECDGKIITEKIGKFLQNNEIALVSSYYMEKNEYAVMVSKEGIEGIWTKGKYICAETSFGKVGVVFSEEVTVPEPIRVYMLEGCSLVVAYGSERGKVKDLILKTRAAENRIYIINSANKNIMSSGMISPDGNFVFSTMKNNEQISSGYLHPYLASFKEVVPKTDVVFGRKPESYETILK